MAANRNSAVVCGDTLKGGLGNVPNEWNEHTDS
jgi:hypothetical protein